MNQSFSKILIGVIVVLLVGGIVVWAYGEFFKQEVQLGKSFRIKAGQTLLIGSEGIQIKFSDVLEDSRCPKNVQCIWAGQAKIKVHVSKEAQDFGDFELTLGTDKSLATQFFDNYSVTLLRLNPYPTSPGKIKIEFSQYVATLIISKIDPSKAETANWQTYRNDEFGFAFKYPSELQANSSGPNEAQKKLDRKETISGTVPPSYDTITFSDSTNKEQFNIVIFPVRRDEVSPSGFKDYLSLGSVCDTRWLDSAESIVGEPTLLNKKGIPILEAQVISGGPRGGSSAGCYYFKNSGGNLVVFNISGFEQKSDFLNVFHLVRDNILSTLMLHPVATPTPVPQSTTPSPIDETKNWEIYRNSKYGFEVKYPDVFVFAYDRKSCQLWEKTDYGGLLSVGIAVDIVISVAASGGLSLSQYVDQYVDEKILKFEKDVQKELKSQTHTFVSGEEAIKIAYSFEDASTGFLVGPNTYTVIFIKKGNNIFEFQYDAEGTHIGRSGVNCSLPNGLFGQKLADQILSTFRFIE